MIRSSLSIAYEEKVILIQMKFSNTMPISPQSMVPPSGTENEECPIVAHNDKVNNLRNRLQYTFLPSSAIFLCRLLKTLRWNNAICHWSSISSQNSFPVE